MNDNKPKIENAELIGQILTACIDLQNSGWGTVFFEIISHTNRVRVHLHDGGWSDGKPCTMEIFEKVTNADGLSFALSQIKSLMPDGNKPESDKLEFDSFSKGVLKYMNNNHHPHCTMIADLDTVTIYEGVKVFHSKEFIKD